MTIRLMLVDRHQILRDGLRALLSQYPEFDIVAEAGDGRCAMDLAGTLRPNIVVTELALPQLNGIELTRQLAARWPEVRVLALSSHHEQRLLSAALCAGAAGYLVKTASIEELVEALHVLSRGQSYISPLVASTVIDAFVRRSSAEPALSDPSLTPREREVLQLLAEGHSTKGIALHLRISAKTVEVHRRQIMAKLDIHSIAELTRYALREGITSL